MSDWQPFTLGALADFVNGYPFKPVDLNGQGLPVVRIKQLLDPSASLDRSDVQVPEKVRISDGDLIFSWSGTLSSRIWRRGPAILNQHLFRVIERDGVVREWLHLALDHAVDELLTKAHGTTMKHVTKGALEAHRVLLPPWGDQLRLVGLFAGLDGHLDALQTELSAAEDLYSNVVSTSFRGGSGASVSLGSALTLSISRSAVMDESVYRIAGVLNAGRGLVDKGMIVGAETSYTTLARLSANQVVMRKLTAWEGPIAIVPVAFDGYFVSAEFPTFDVNSSVLWPDFMAHLCRWPGLWHQMRLRVTGSVQRRKRLNPEQLLAIELPLPTLEAQKDLAATLSLLRENINCVTEELAALHLVRKALLDDMFTRRRVLPSAETTLEPVT